MSVPRVSIIVPTCRRPEALKACVSSLLGQRPPPGGFEIVVVDDGDGLPPLPSEVRTVASGGIGPAAARNVGAESARGEVLAFTDDDCDASPTWVRELDAVVRRDPEAGAAGATVNGVPQNIFAVASQLTLDAAHAHFAAAGEPRFAASCNLALPAAAFRALGGFEPGFRYAEDRDLCARWHASGRRLRWAPRAEVFHRRQMDMRGFVRQHTGYGRGAYALHHRIAGSAIAPPVQPGFYKVLVEQVRRAPRQRPRLAVLAVVTQAAAAGGFALEALATRYGIGVRGCAEPALAMPVRAARL